MTARLSAPKRMVPFKAWILVGHNGGRFSGVYESRRLVERIGSRLVTRTARVEVREIVPKRRPK